MVSARILNAFELLFTIAVHEWSGQERKVILKELKISGFRPFYEEDTLAIEPDVTVLTGANDVGKSAILAILKQLWSERSLDDVNEDRIMRSGVDPSDDASLIIVVTYQLTPSYVDMYPDLSIYRKWEVDVHFRAMTRGHFRIEIRDESGAEAEGVPGFQPPRFGIDLAGSGTIRSVIPGDSPSDTEQTLLNLAFGSSEDWQGLERHSSNIQNTLRDRANERLASALEPLKPESLDLSLSIDYHSRGPLSFVVALQDGRGGRAGPQLRGAGYQKLIGLMLALSQHVSDPEPKILVFDEPENSLHSDAQHALRGVLETIAQHEHIQVIYATHSPAMINPSRPQSLRLLFRDTTDENVATTRIDNKPYVDGNFQSIRSQLGVLPADSLMFASIGIIAEGPTERLALNELIKKLNREADQQEYPNLKLHWRLSFVVSAGGTGEFRRWIEFAKAQNVSVIALLDGDSIKLGNDLEQEYEDIRVVCFDEGTEIEEVVDENIYFEALEAVVPGNHKNMKKEYVNWLSQSQYAEGKMFSKRVDMWLKEKLGKTVDKPKTMAKAIELARMDQICWTKVDELIAAIENAANDL